MICETCHGNHFRRLPSGATEPCPECIGGVSSCCEGPTPTQRDVPSYMDTIRAQHAALDALAQEGQEVDNG